MIVRPFRPDDAPGVVAVIRGTFEEYGFAWDAEGYCSDLANPAASYDRFWCVEVGEGVVGCVGLDLHAMIPGAPGTSVELEGEPRVCATDCELVRLYVARHFRGNNLGEQLARTVLAEARALGRTAMEIWSDKKLEHAHRLYLRMGAEPAGERICPGDPDKSPEWGFILPLDGSV